MIILLILRVILVKLVIYHIYASYLVKYLGNVIINYDQQAIIDRFAKTDDEKESAKKLAEEKQDLLSKIKLSLSNKVKDVVISTRLTESPVCLVSGDGISFEMEKGDYELLNSFQNKKINSIKVSWTDGIGVTIDQIANQDEDKI